MSNLFALDKEFAFCQGERKAYKAGGMQVGGGRAWGGGGAGNMQARV